MTDVKVANAQSLKTLTIGRAWDNSATATGNQPKFRAVIDRDLGLSVTLTPGSQLVFFPNTNKREGKQDADYRVAVSLPAEVVDAEIKRQQAARAAAPATTATVA